MTEATANNLNMKIAVLGLGCGGVRTLNALAALPAADKLFLYALDTDGQTLGQSKLPETHRLMLDEQWRQGQGCGGDPLKGQRAIARVRGSLEQQLTGFDYVIVVGGLGGGFASGAVVALSGLLSTMKIPAIHLLTIPFSWEGQAKRKIADGAIAEILNQTDCLMALPNDLLFSVLSPESPAREAFLLADGEIARAIIAVAEILTNRNIIPADYSDLAAILKERKSFCSIGVGIAALNEVQNPGELAVDRMLSSPLLGGVGKLREADVILISLLGGPELSIAQLQQSAASVEKCCGEYPRIILSANTAEEYANCILASAIAIKYTEKAKIKVRKKQSSLKEQQVVSPVPPESESSPEQLALPLPQPPVDKGIFFNSVQVVYNGEDLDIPTFQRREIPIDREEK